MKKAILVAIIGAMTLGVNAGDWGKAPVAPAKAPIEECYDIGGEISFGYETDYMFRGSRLGRDSIWTDVNYTIDSIVPITVGAWYISELDPANNFDDELDLYVSAALGTYGGFDVDLGYTRYIYPGAGGDTGEINLGLSRSLGFVDLALGTNYDHTLDTWYHEAGVEKTFGITDSMSLVIGAGVGYGVNNWTHYYATAALPIELNCRATLTPYIGWNGVPSDWIGGDIATGNNGDVLHSGVSLSVSF
ncbi:MAG: hypothetical protein P1U86_14800 [Verrucomicrobiales bacterium]|nr:hypothetical protein [Verrucomicrobiales bacterium]